MIKLNQTYWILMKIWEKVNNNKSRFYSSRKDNVLKMKVNWKINKSKYNKANIFRE